MTAVSYASVTLPLDDALSEWRQAASDAENVQVDLIVEKFTTGGVYDI